MNFTLQDILGATLAFFLFPIVIVFPGYVLGWAFDLFDFRLRQPNVRLGIGLVLSFAVSPILLYLTSSLLSFNFALFTLGGFAAVFVIISIKEKFILSSNAKSLCWIGGIWTVIAILSLINVQWNDQLYFSVTSYDQTTRVSIIEAMTRTGIPPVNPSYYPRHPVKLTFLYYFWYILGSMVDVIGGKYVDARAALNASSAWSGIGLMAVIALYIRQRNASSTAAAWRSARIGIGLLTVSGLDVFPILFLMARTGLIVGSVDVWNTWIPSWIASNLWVPHHVAALIVGLSAMMLAQSTRGMPILKQFAIMVIAGLGFASAFGLSVYVAFVFVVFWCVWLAALFLQNKERGLILPMIFTGMVALFLSIPFLMGLFQGAGGGADGQFPIIFEVRSFLQLESFVKDWTPFERSLIMLALLPVNYIMELGFFFMAAIYWFKIKEKAAIRSSPFYLAEAILLAIVFLIGSCLRSTLITSNDLGWRAWLPGQFILLIWGVDVLENLVFTSQPVSSLTGEAKKNRKLILVFLSIGILTSVMDAVLLRTAWPFMTGAGETHKYYSARLAYDYLREHVPADIITQNNPLNYVDRPSGLYGTHQMTISDRTAYGVSFGTFNRLVNEVGLLFTIKDVSNWHSIDGICHEHSIDILIIEDIDPIWSSIPVLELQRPSIYENAHYALFACGDYVK